MFRRITYIFLVILYIFYKSDAQSETRNQSNFVDLEAPLPEPRAYIPDSQYLDFVYHNHEELTKFLRFS